MGLFGALSVSVGTCGPQGVIARERLTEHLRSAPRQAADPDKVVGGVVSGVIAPTGRPTDFQPTTTYWRGKSGRLYRHSAHTTVYCPPPTHGVYVLAKRDGEGNVVPLFAGVSASPAGTLNLAHIRKLAARLGASEVHLCPLIVTGSIFGLRRIVRDVRANFATLH